MNFSRVFQTSRLIDRFSFSPTSRLKQKFVRAYFFKSSLRAMSLPSATPPPRDPQQKGIAVADIDDYNNVEPKNTIRTKMRQRPWVKNWGFSIIRCTYSSQARWEEYLRQIRSHIDRTLKYKEDASLRETLDIPIIEDEALDGASWTQARDKFDEWVQDDLKKPQDVGESSIASGITGVDLAISHSLRWEFFIFADQASVDSVVDFPEGRYWRYPPGSYFFTVVATGLKETRLQCIGDDGVAVKIPDDETDPEYRRALLQKFRASEYVQLYASCLDDDWPDLFAVDEAGVSYHM